MAWTMSLLSTCMVTFRKKFPKKFLNHLVPLLNHKKLHQFNNLAVTDYDDSIEIPEILQKEVYRC